MLKLRASYQIYLELKTTILRKFEGAYPKYKYMLMPLFSTYLKYPQNDKVLNVNLIKKKK